MTVINYAPAWNLSGGRPRRRQDVHEVATDTRVQGINLQERERAT